MSELNRQRIHHLTEQFKPAASGKHWLCWAVLITCTSDLMITLIRL